MLNWAHTTPLFVLQNQFCFREDLESIIKQTIDDNIISEQREKNEAGKGEVKSLRTKKKAG